MSKSQSPQNNPPSNWDGFANRLTYKRIFWAGSWLLRYFFSKKQNLIFVFLLFFFACSNNTIEKEAPLPFEKTARIFADQLLVEAATNSTIPGRKDSLQHLYFKQVFEMHDTDLETYRKSLNVHCSGDSAVEHFFDFTDSLLKK